MSETWIIPETFVHHPHGTEGRFLIPRQSPWFSGHFPDMPVLPAIGMLDMVHDTLLAYAAHHGVRLTIREMKRVRFRQILGPESHFTVFLSPDIEGNAPQVSFHCTSDDPGETKVCEGTLLVTVERS